MKLYIIGGMPCTGKTTLINEVRRTRKNPVIKNHNLFHYVEYDDIIIAGKFDGSVNEGTDRLAMNVYADTIDFLRTNKKDVLIEGDRFYNQSFISALRNYDTKIIQLITDNETELLRRYRMRPKMQSQSFLKGRHTKLNNISKVYEVRKISSNKKTPQRIRKLIGL